MDEAAVLAKTSYDFFHDGLEKANEELAEYGFQNYRVDPLLSDSHSVVIDRPGQSAVVSMRGTATFADLIPDARIALGAHVLPGGDDRFDEARGKLSAAIAKYGDAIPVGHSLGGALALHAARSAGKRAIAFNPGSSPLGEIPRAVVCSALGNCGPSSDVYTTGTDPISYSSYLADGATDNVIKVPSKKNVDFLTHSLLHFLPAKQSSTFPSYLDPVDAATGDTVPVCIAFPELCGKVLERG